MRWSYIICLLLVSTVFARPRPKRSLGYIKSFISNKLFGSKTVIIQPILAKNETYQLFKIPGYDDIVIKVTRINESVKKEEPVKIEDAVIVNPEVAIIGSYLGTTTQKETLLAIEVAKRLLKSGILRERGSSVQELMVPMVPQEYFDVPIIQHTRTPLLKEYPPPLFVHEEPIKSKYFYKQKAAQADMTYESYNHGDVIVTRTEKEPPLPQYIKLRLAEVATIGANPYMLSQLGPLNVNRVPIPVPQYVNPGIMTRNVQGMYFSQDSMRNRVVPPEYVGNNIYRGPIVVDENPVLLSQSTPYAVNPYHLENMRRVIICREKLGKMCPHENILLKNDKIDKTSNLGESNQPPKPVVNIDVSKSDNDTHRIAVNEFLKNHSVNGQLVSQYIYKQMNHRSNENYTEVKVGEAPKLSNEAVETGNDLNKDFVYIPPMGVSSMPTVLRLHNEEVIDNIDRKQDDKNAFISKVISNKGKRYVPSLSAFSNKQMDVDSFEQHPIVVTEQINVEKRGNLNAKTYEHVETKNHIDENRRGDIPGATY